MKNNTEFPYVIVRSDKAGVFFGQLVNKDRDEVTLNNCRKLYYWNGACAIEQIAQEGIIEKSKKDCKFTITVQNATILFVNQIIPCTENAITSIQSVSIWKL
jgi:hypothetical protein